MMAAMKRYALLISAALAVPVPASGQSSPGFSYGQVPTAGQWNAAFASKQDRLTFSPLNQAGGTMTGRLQTAPSTINAAGFAVLPGVAPTAPSNGDIWVTSTGLFVRVNGQTATLPTIGTTAGTVAAGNDSRIVGAAPTVSPAFTGTPQAPTASAGTNSSQIATTAFLTVASPRVDLVQSLSLAQQLQGRQNLGDRGAGVLAKSAAYTVATTDAGRLVAGSGTWALTLPTAASVGNGFAIEVANTGTGVITVTPSGSDTVRGGPSIAVNARESGVLISDGAAWQAVGFSPVLIASNSSASGGYVRYSNGYISQWGAVAGSSSDTTITFTLAFTTTPAVVANISSANSSSSVLEAVGLSNITSTSFIGRPRANGGSSVQASEPWNWRAEGF